MNAFAEACYDQNTIEDLESALSGTPDVADMKEWKLSEDEWKEQIQEAIDELKSDD